MVFNWNFWIYFPFYRRKDRKAESNHALAMASNSDRRELARVHVTQSSAYVREEATRDEALMHTGSSILLVTIPHPKATPGTSPALRSRGWGIV